MIRYIRPLLIFIAIIGIIVAIAIADRKIYGIPKPYYLQGLRYEIKQLFNPHNSYGDSFVRLVDAKKQKGGDIVDITINPDMFSTQIENEMFIWLINEDIFRFISHHYKDVSQINVTTGYKIDGIFEDYYKISCPKDKLNQIDWADDYDYIAIVKLPQICKVNLNRFKENGE